MSNLIVSAPAETPKAKKQKVLTNLLPLSSPASRDPSTPVAGLGWRRGAAPELADSMKTRMLRARSASPADGDSMHGARAKTLLKNNMG